METKTYIQKQNQTSINKTYNMLNRIYEIHVHVSRYIFISKIELIERRIIDKVKVDHPEENEVTLLTNYKPVM